VVALNAALALHVGGAIAEAASSTIPCAAEIALAHEILQSGAAWTKVEQLVAFLQE
jgi:anthranilate phosphoribosyltransferase